MTGSPNEDSNAITKSRLPKVTVSAIFYNNRNAQKGHAHAKGQQGDRTIESAVVHIARNILSGLKRSDNFIPVVEQVTEYFQEMADVKSNASSNWASLLDGFKKAGTPAALEFHNLLKAARDQTLDNEGNREVHRPVSRQQKIDNRDQFTVKIHEILDTTSGEFWVRSKGATTDFDLSQVPNFNDGRPVIHFLAHAGIVTKLQTMRGNKQLSSRKTAAIGNISIEEALPDRYKNQNKDIKLTRLGHEHAAGGYIWVVYKMSIKNRKQPTQRRK